VAEQVLNQSFVLALTACQSKLYGYIMVFVLDPAIADEVLQNTNVALCQHACEFPSIRDFTAWACKTAYLQVLTYRKFRRRDRHLLDNDLLESLADRMEARIAEFSPRHEALRGCLNQLPERQRTMILKRYSDAASVDRLARELGRSPSVVSQTLYRIRMTLANCIKSKLATESQE
jgi:RNA polymerase sigma-70 factor, ECF subfamily